jgi:thiamine-monophosphate kinase
MPDPNSGELADHGAHRDMGELAVVERIRKLLPAAPEGQVWVGDDAAVLAPSPGPLLLATDAVVAGVHVDLSICGIDDLGWKAVAVTVSDIAAMGGRPRDVVVSVTAPPGTDLDCLMAGAAESAHAHGCAIVGGDLTGGEHLVVVVAATGILEDQEGAQPRGAVLRSGARPGDFLCVTGPLGSSAAGLRLLQSKTSGGSSRQMPDSGGLSVQVGDRLAAMHRRPEARIAAGRVAREAGATAMMDLSDGLALDARRLAAASEVGLSLRELPVAEGASLAEAIGGGEDYELLIAVEDPEVLNRSFVAAGLPAARWIGQCTDRPGEFLLDDGVLPPGGFTHQFG